MEALSSATPQPPLPRLRVSRASPSGRLDVNASVASSQAGPSRLPDLSQLVDLNLSDIRASHEFTDEDEEQDQHPTPRVNTAPLSTSATSNDKLADRLRALVALVPNGSGSRGPPTPQRPHSPTFLESDFEGESGIPAPSFARESLRDIFSKALREPGNAPRKGRQRRNSDGGASEVDASPATARQWSDIKGKRKSLSDEEGESPAKSERQTPYIDSYSQRTILRPLRQNNAIEFPLKSISADDSDDAEDSLNPRKISPPNATSTPMQSLRLSQNSSFPQHSNLLDQDSEMQRAFGQLDNFDQPSIQSQSYRETSTTQAARTNFPTVVPGPLVRSTAIEKSHTPKVARKAVDSHVSSSRPVPAPSGSKANLHDDHRRGNGLANSREKRRTSLHGSTSPLLKHKISSTSQLSDQASSASLTDSASRITEMGQGRSHEQEREWNKPHNKTTRPSNGRHLHSPKSDHRSRTSSISSLESPRPGSAMSVDSVESPRARVRTLSGLSDRPRTQSLMGAARPGSALSNISRTVQDFPQVLRRHHSLTSRSDSPSGSSTGNGSQSEEVLMEHERERNWNSPHPKWHRRSLTNTPIRPASPSPSMSPTFPHSPSGHRHQVKAPTSPTTLKDASNTLRLDFKAAPSSPAERKHSTSPLSAKSSYSRIPTGPTSTPARPRSPLSRHTPHRKSHIPIPSNRNHKVETAKPVPVVQVVGELNGLSVPNGVSLSQESMELTEAYNAHEINSALPSFSASDQRIPAPNNDTMHTASLLGPSNSRGDTKVDSDDGDEDLLSRERTPTLRTVGPPAEASYIQAPPHMNETDEGHMSPNQEAMSPPSDFQPLEPADQDPPSIPSFLLTPPRSRQSSLTSPKPEFQTPPPPKGLPELPEPPLSASGDETESDSMPRFDLLEGRIASGNEKGNFTAFQTPKPPGAWFTTPARPMVHGDAADEFKNGGQSEIVPHSSIFPLTPAPPGGWSNTPAPRGTDLLDRQEPESVLNEGGLTTPVTSIGRANTHPFKTPAPPGAWAITPGARKSILKVRFESEVHGQVNESSEALSNNTTDQSTKKRTFDTSELSNSAPRSTTPDPITPSTPPSRSPRKLRRSPNVRMVDAYGNERKEDHVRKRDAPSPTPQTAQNQGGVRIVDAMGREVKEEKVKEEEVKEEKVKEDKQPSQTVDEEAETSIQEIPISRAEAFQRVRQGIVELVEGIESLDFTNSAQAPDDRVNELDEVSRASRQSREHLRRDIRKAETELRRQVQHKISTVSNWSDKVVRNHRLLFLVGTLQVVFLFVMYRASVLRARKMFLTNYYDPFNPDLFLYTTHPNTQYATATTSWDLVTQAARSGDLTAFTDAFRENLSILVKGWHQQLWDVWGDDPNRPIGAWPPT